MRRAVPPTAEGSLAGWITVLLGLLSLVSLAACSGGSGVPAPASSSTPSATPTVAAAVTTPATSAPAMPSTVAEGSTQGDEAWTMYGGRPEGFAFSLPSDWFLLDMSNKAALADGLALLDRRAPSVSDFVRGQECTGKEAACFYKYWAFDLSNRGLESQLIPDLRLRKLYGGTGLTQEAFTQSLVESMENLSGKLLAGPITSTLVTLPGGEAVRLDYHTKCNCPSDEPLMAARRYVFRSTSALYMFEFTSAVADFDTYSPVFDRIARTFSLAGY